MRAGGEVLLANASEATEAPSPGGGFAQFGRHDLTKPFIAIGVLASSLVVLALFGGEQTFPEAITSSSAWLGVVRRDPRRVVDVPAYLVVTVLTRISMFRKTRPNLQKVLTGNEPERKKRQQQSFCHFSGHNSHLCPVLLSVTSQSVFSFFSSAHFISKETSTLRPQ